MTQRKTASCLPISAAVGAVLTLTVIEPLGSIEGQAVGGDGRKIFAAIDDRYVLTSMGEPRREKAANRSRSNQRRSSQVLPCVGAAGQIASRIESFRGENQHYRFVDEFGEQQPRATADADVRPRQVLVDAAPPYFPSSP